MSAEIECVGLLAGEGDLPHQLIEHCVQNTIPICVVRFKNLKYQPYDVAIPLLETRLEKVGEIFKFFKKNKVNHVVMVGSLQKPSLKSLRPDLRGLKTLGKIAKSYGRGDDNLLKLLKQDIEQEGFKIVGIDRYLNNLTAAQGTLTQERCKLSASDIQKAIEETLHHGRHDKGQSVLLHKDGTFAYEDRAGTTALIKEHGYEGSILFKFVKPQQDRDLDRPTTGIHTLKALYEKKCLGMVVEADSVFMVNKDDMVDYAHAHGLFIEARNA
jgi:DUF1009 family protein